MEKKYFEKNIFDFPQNPEILGNLLKDLPKDFTKISGFLEKVEDIFFKIFFSTNFFLIFELFGLFIQIFFKFVHEAQERTSLDMICAQDHGTFKWVWNGV